jgi:hypothetical protein
VLRVWRRTSQFTRPGLALLARLVHAGARRRGRMVGARTPEALVGYWRITELEVWDVDYLGLVVPGLHRARP